jgi:hypothetical protein
MQNVSLSTSDPFARIQEFLDFSKHFIYIDEGLHLQASAGECFVAHS